MIDHREHPKRPSIEQLWRSSKYEQVYLWAYDSFADAVTAIGRYFGFYNTTRTRQPLGSRFGNEVYFQDSGLREAA